IMFLTLSRSTHSAEVLISQSLSEQFQCFMTFILTRGVLRGSFFPPHDKYVSKLSAAL
ncbi:hypothetical protein CHS0354_043005, partial [Potamilus streckersoni]